MKKLLIALLLFLAPTAYAVNYINPYQISTSTSQTNWVLTASATSTYWAAAQAGSGTFTTSTLAGLTDTAWLLQGAGGISISTTTSPSKITLTFSSSTAGIPTSIQNVISFPIPVASTSLGVQTPLSLNTNTLVIATATTNTNGILTSTDWNTFNNKQPTITFPIPVASTSLSVGGGLLTLNGNVLNNSANYVSSTACANGIQCTSTGAVNLSGTYQFTTSSLYSTTAFYIASSSGNVQQFNFPKLLNDIAGLATTTGNTLLANGTTWTSVATSSLGLQSVLSFPLAYASTTHIGFPIPYASTTGFVMTAGSNINISSSSGNWTFAWNAAPSTSTINTATTTGLWFTNATGTNVNVNGILNLGNGVVSNFPLTSLITSSTYKGYGQNVFLNNAITATSSESLVVGNSSTTQTNYYGEFGINGWGYNDPTFSGQTKHDVFLIASDGRLFLSDTTSTGQGIVFSVGTTTQNGWKGGLSSGGNWSFGTTTDAGVTAYVSGSTTITNTVSSTNAYFGTATTTNRIGFSGDSTSFPTAYQSLAFNYLNATTSATSTSIAQKLFYQGITINQINCSTNGASVPIALDERASSTPDTAGTALIGTVGLTCSSGGASTSTFTQATVAALKILNFTIASTSMANSTTTLRVNVQYKFQ